MACRRARSTGVRECRFTNVKTTFKYPRVVTIPTTVRWQPQNATRRPRGPLSALRRTIVQGAQLQPRCDNSSAETTHSLHFRVHSRCRRAIRPIREKASRSVGCSGTTGARDPTWRWPLFFHKLVDAPVAEVRRIDGPRAVHGDVMWDINLARNLAERTQHTQNLAVQIHLDNA